MGGEVGVQLAEERRRSTMRLASSMGMANPMFDAVVDPLLPATAVLMPMTSPFELTSGPPELPELIAASV